MANLHKRKGFTQQTAPTWAEVPRPFRESITQTFIQNSGWQSPSLLICPPLPVLELEKACPESALALFPPPPSMSHVGSCCWPAAGTQLLPPYLLQPGAGSGCCPGCAPHPPLLSSSGSAGWAPPCSAQVPSLPPSHLGREHFTRLRSFPGRPGKDRLFSSWQQVPEAGWNQMQTTKWFVNNFVAISEGFALCCDTGCCYSGEPIAGEGRAVCRKYCFCLLTNSWDIRHPCTAPCTFLAHSLTGSLSVFSFLSFPPLPVVHTHRFSAERAQWRGGFALSAKVRALSVHTQHRFVLVTYEQVMARSSGEENNHGSPMQLW